MKKLLLCLLICLLPLAAAAELEVHCLDVDHGDCTILLCDGEAMIIDGGAANKSDLVFTWIRNLKISALKYAFATHPNTDHVGGLPAAFHAAQVGVLYTPVLQSGNSRFQVLLRTAEEKGVPVAVPQVGDMLTLGAAEITVLSPGETSGDMNDMSIVLRIVYGDVAFLFCGDAGEKVERQLLNDGAQVRAQVLRAGHHGSDTATSEAFLRAVAPRYAVISCSERYDNPDTVIMERLLNLNAIPLCTEYVGDVVIRTDGKTLQVNTESFYVGNRNSDVFHRMSCPSVEKMKEKNKQTIYSCEQAEKEGFRPCRNCSPS